MSSEALSWAFKQTVKPSGAKFTLVAMCECANYKTGRITPSIAHLEEITGQNRKTIIAHIAQLEAQGFIRDTGERTGRTKQIKVYAAGVETVPKAEPSQERNSSENDAKQSQNRDTEPSWEPSDALSNDKAIRAFRRKDWPDIPAWVPVDPWNGYMAMRRDKRKLPTARAVGIMIGKLERWRAQGHDPGAILDTSTEQSWTGIWEPQRNDRKPSDDDQIRNPYARVAARQAAGAGQPSG